MKTDFSIRFTSFNEDDSLSADDAKWGELVIGSFRERFLASLSFWSVADYERHWIESVVRIVHSEQTSVLITSMYDPSVANFIIWWPMYRTGKIITIQNHILFLDKLDSSFSIENPFAAVPQYESVNEDGEKISEWLVSIEALENFLKRGFTSVIN